MPERCTVCGGGEFRSSAILWPDLVSQWQLSPAEAAYIDRQQGRACAACGSNLRSMALAKAIVSSHSFDGLLQDFVASRPAAALRVLEINEAGSLTPVLSRLPRHRLVRYPEVDLMRLPMGPGEFDLVLHSDTLEHVESPVAALAECRRVLAAAGRCIFTVPVIVGRLSRSRAGLAPSYHGSAAESGSDLLVRTEFGADLWEFVLAAGYSSATIHCLEYPAALAIEARA